MMRDEILFFLTAAGTLSWIVCFFWMHRISSRQDALLDEIRSQAKRIERLSRDEHELIREVHPQVGHIKESIEKMAATISEEVEQKKSDKK